MGLVSLFFTPKNHTPEGRDECERLEEEQRG